ncbi:MAG: UDP-forming cellulose synthase catalytic subunit [Cyanobacteria bacterium J06627_15]
MMQTPYSQGGTEAARPDLASPNLVSNGLGGWLLRWPQWLARLLPGNRPLLLFLVGLLMALSLPLIVVPLTIWQQCVVAVMLIALGWGIVRLEQRQSQQQASEYLHLLLAWLSVVTTLRYFYYRTAYTLNLDGWVNGFFSLLLYAAEIYAIGTLVLAYFQTLKLRERQPVDLSQLATDQLPPVDIYIPTYNEDVEIVRKTALAALAVDYPAEKKQVYILDDGRAPKYRTRRNRLHQMCAELGCTLLTRDNNDHAKAGNINTALQRTQGDLILILDCDHIPTREILQRTVGFFKDPKVSLVQTPHWFYNPDPFERNLLTEGRIPVGNELFYKILQKGNDFWNAAFFCGSAAVIRRDHLIEVGGIATETVTEDCHTSLRLHSLGYKSVYYDKIMVAGLAPEKFSAYVGQQVRWARGMAQILRLENPLFNRKLNLSLPQRLCYLSATSHFFFGFPRLMYAIAPILYLLFGINLVRGLGVETVAYALPHIVLALNANYITYKTVRYSFWNEIFEYAMAFQDGLVTCLALLNPKLGKFNVTDKGVSITERSFDWESARISVVITALLLLSLFAVPFRILLQPETAEAVFINGFWSVFNLLLLLAALVVALEQPQLRRTHRLQRQLAVTLHGSQQRTWQGQTLDISESGARIGLSSWPNLADRVDLEIQGDSDRRVALTAEVIRVDPVSDRDVVVSVDFTQLTQAQMDALVLVLYSDVGTWYSQVRNIIDRPLASLTFIATALRRAFKTPQPAQRMEVYKQISAAARLYHNGRFYTGFATAMNSRQLQLQIEGLVPEELQVVQKANIPLGLILSQTAQSSESTRLLVKLADIKRVEATATGTPQSSRLQLDLTFPKPLDDRQGDAVRHLLNTLE